MTDIQKQTDLTAQLAQWVLVEWRKKHDEVGDPACDGDPQRACLCPKPSALVAYEQAQVIAAELKKYRTCVACGMSLQDCNDARGRSSTPVTTMCCFNCHHPAVEHQAPETYMCPVCDYDKLRGPAADHRICPQCQTHFGYDDANTSHVELRARWKASRPRIENSPAFEAAALKPPIGVMPRWLHEQQRALEVMQAIWRYIEAGAPIPDEWMAEFTDYVRVHAVPRVE